MGSPRKWEALPEERLDPAELPRLPEKLELACQACGHVADYDVDLGSEEGWERLADLYAPNTRPASHPDQAGSSLNAPHFLEHSGTSELAEAIVRTPPRIGRNDPCPCGSGKKYKRCCSGS